MMNYLERPLLEYYTFIIRPRSTLIPRSKLLLKQQRMVPNLYPAGLVLNTPSTTEATCASRPHAKLHKRHNILSSFHFIRSILSQQYINLMHIKSEYNCSDLLTKHLGYNVVWKHNIIQLLFHFAGNTANLMYDDTLLVDTFIDESKLSSLFDEHGEYEILQEAMEQGLRMNS